MRSESEVTNLILQVARQDERIRAVVLNGSRANPNARKDVFQDFDIVYVVNQLDTFLMDHSWVNIFGERLIMQMPDQMCFGEKDEHSFAYLMLFTDGNRIDLTLFPVEKLTTHFKHDSLTIVLLDKDHLFENLPLPSEKDYLIQAPSQQEFTDVCNEFWWVSTYVVKGLCRNEITYARNMLEIPVRDMFFKMIEWHIGIHTSFSVTFGKAGKKMKEQVEPELYEKILTTYPDANPDNIWKALLVMTALFKDMAKEIERKMNFTYNIQEEQNIMAYIQSAYKSQQKII
ncbi:aminoglycoside 6-adenylyltransferase [Rhodocytophaga rosea]|uniref:Aminoglycoside 6-adenylyltransferase n=1 Tax=Rhodocytophaga rosea TaxID=2704465 RepID=A0A6C0GQU0_9BACT|nr:aminoglycoside 6-adenylyltransferase [Rhodocytophaga rosea]QHT69932.1 aminoglycoside 6-adenylyltransferase [Rhodocytophaga rosea]